MIPPNPVAGVFVLRLHLFGLSDAPAPEAVRPKDGVAMKTRLYGWGLLVGCLSASLTGCDTWSPRSQFLRKNADTSIETNTTTRAIGGDEEISDATSAPKGFFKDTRMSGGWSSEAAEIEKHLGVQ
jgi:hypothetical protein